MMHFLWTERGFRTLALSPAGGVQSFRGVLLPPDTERD
jgi:hypothetical protein